MHCLGSDELAFEKRLNPFCYEMHEIWLERCFKSRKQFHGFPLITSRTITAGHFKESTFWLHKMADRVSSWRKRYKTVEFRGMFVWIMIIHITIFLYCSANGTASQYASEIVTTSCLCSKILPKLTSIRCNLLYL